MLVLSRQRDETIMIGDEVEVTIVDIRGDKVRLGITAPKEVAVHRKEVYEAIKRENRAAAQVRPEDLAQNLTGAAGGMRGPSPGGVRPVRPGQFRQAGPRRPGERRIGPEAPSSPAEPQAPPPPAPEAPADSPTGDTLEGSQ